MVPDTKKRCICPFRGNHFRFLQQKVLEMNNYTGVCLAISGPFGAALQHSRAIRRLTEGGAALPIPSGRNPSRLLLPSGGGSVLIPFSPGWGGRVVWGARTGDPVQ